MDDANQMAQQRLVELNEERESANQLRGELDHERATNDKLHRQLRPSTAVIPGLC